METNYTCTIPTNLTIHLSSEKFISNTLHVSYIFKILVCNIVCVFLDKQMIHLFKQTTKSFMTFYIMSIKCNSVLSLDFFNTMLEG